MSEQATVDTTTQETTAAPTPKPAGRGIEIAESAAARLKQMLQQHKKGPEAGLRIAVRGGGCSGLTYTMDFDDKPKEKDKVFERDGVKVFVDSKSLLYLGGSELVYEEGLMAAGFKLRNPNAKASCGCGESFSV